jgi:succinoglycan biosynthesis protein ExoA
MNGSGSEPSWPSVSVVVPVRNDASALPAAIESVLRQEYPGRLEVIVAVGPSTDDTATVAAGLAAADSRVAVIDNAEGHISTGLNVAIAASNGEIVVRVDGHCALESGHLRRAVETLRETGADNVGGVQSAQGSSPFQRAVAAGMTSRFGTGDARFHYGGEPGPVDTVYLGAFRRAALERVGGYDETLLANEDYELNWRIRETGGVVWFDPELRVQYAPRASLRAFARQYFEYGRWKREMLRRHPRSLRLRQVAPPVTVLANAAGLVAGALVDRRFLLVPAAYLVATVGASVAVGRAHGVAVTMRLPVVFATMHHAWGAGFLLGRLK